jgi:hypothetical protein
MKHSTPGMIRMQVISNQQTTLLTSTSRSGISLTTNPFKSPKDIIKTNNQTDSQCKSTEDTQEGKDFSEINDQQIDVIELLKLNKDIVRWKFV